MNTLRWGTIALVFVAYGCGYTVVRYDEQGRGPSRISIKTLTNDTAEPGVEMLVTEALRREFLARGGVRLVSNPKQADLVIRGRVPKIDTKVRSFSDVVLALEYELTLRISLRLEAPDGRKLAVEKLSLQDTEVYLSSADLEVGRKNRKEALRRVAQLLASRAHDALERVLQ